MTTNGNRADSPAVASRVSTAVSDQTGDGLSGDGRTELDPGSRASRVTENGQDTRFLEILDIVCENVASDWKPLAEKLCINKKEIQAIERKQSRAEDCCWQALSHWSRSSSQCVTSTRELIEALHGCRQGRMADMVNRLVYSAESIEDVLFMHMDREYKTREAMYIITDSAAKHWRLLGLRLGLTKGDISLIENSLPAGRTREKCMQALYRWRSLVPMSEYKVASLILVLRECQLHDVAVPSEEKVSSDGTYVPRKRSQCPAKLEEEVDITQMAASPDKLHIRRKKKGEVLIHLDVEQIGIEVPGQEHTVSQRPRYLMPREAMRHYVLNRIFIRFLDALDAQERTGPHPLVTLFYELNASCISEVCRRGQYLAVSCPRKADQEEIWRMAENGMLSAKLTEVLVGEDIRQKLGMKEIRLGCTVHETELCTPRTGVSQATHRSDYSCY